MSAFDVPGNPLTVGGNGNGGNGNKQNGRNGNNGGTNTGNTAPGLSDVSTPSSSNPSATSFNFGLPTLALPSNSSSIQTASTFSSANATSVSETSASQTALTSNTQSQTTSTQGSSSGAPLTTSSTQSRSQVVIGVSVFVAILLITAFIALAFWARRRRSRMVSARYNRANSAVFTVSPFNLFNPEIPAGSPEHSDGRNSHGSTLRQQYLQNELRAVREKMVDMADLQQEGAEAATDPQRRLSRILRFMSIRKATTRTSRASGGLASQLEASRARNEALAARIRELETQVDSEWALGLSDEPPPGYMA